MAWIAMKLPNGSMWCPINTSVDSIKRAFIHLYIFVMYFICFIDTRWNASWARCAHFSHSVRLHLFARHSLWSFFKWFFSPPHINDAWEVLLRIKGVHNGQRKKWNVSCGRRRKSNLYNNRFIMTQNVVIKLKCWFSKEKVENTMEDERCESKCQHPLNVL